MSSWPTFPGVSNSGRVAVRPDVQIAEEAVTEVRVSRDVCPLTDFRTSAAKFIEQVRVSNQPMILTQHGRGAAVLLGIEAYEKLLDELDLLRDVRDAEDEIAAGRAVEHVPVAVRLRGLIGR